MGIVVAWTTSIPFKLHIWRRVAQRRPLEHGLAQSSIEPISPRRGP